MRLFFHDWRRLKSLPGYRGVVWWMLDQSFWVILVYRLISSAKGSWIYLPLRIVEKFFEFIFKSYVPTTVTIGPGLVLFHAYGVLLNGRSIIGDDCTIYARVCIGSRWPGDDAPVIGNNVVIGTGACIFGPVNIPDNYIVKANSVITPSSLL